MDSSKDASTGSERPISRRALLGSSLTLGVSRTSLAQNSQPTEDHPVRRIKLGRTGAIVTRLGFGGSFPEYGRRMLRIAYRSGLRYFDNGDFYAGYQAEKRFGEWAKKLNKRDELFVVTKARTTNPTEFVDRLHEALELLQLDTIDLFLVHGIVDPGVALDRHRVWAKLKDRLVREKKIRFMGFSTHAPMPTRIECLKNAVKSGWMDVVMPACDPCLIRSNDELNRALDGCAKAGFGLVVMKVFRGLDKAGKQPAGAVETFKRMGFSPHTAMLAGMLDDGRFHVVVAEMPNIRILEENLKIVHPSRKPLGGEDWQIYERAAKKLTRATCQGCDGLCQRAAGVKTDFYSIARYLAYYEEDGKRDLARNLYAQLPPEYRQFEGADLEAASRACPAGLDLVSLYERVNRFLA